MYIDENTLTTLSGAIITLLWKHLNNDGIHMAFLSRKEEGDDDFGTEFDE